LLPEGKESRSPAKTAYKRTSCVSRQKKRAGHIAAASTNPLRYDRQHAAACYSNYKRALAGSDREYFNPDFLRRVEAQAPTDGDTNEAS